jgi:transposase
MSTKTKRKRHSAVFKAQVGMDAVLVIKTTAQIARDLSVHPGQVSQWKAAIKARLPELFEAGAKPAEDSERLVADLHRKIGELTVDLDYLKESPSSWGCRRVARLDRSFVTVRRNRSAVRGGQDRGGAVGAGGHDGGLRSLGPGVPPAAGCQIPIVLLRMPAQSGDHAAQVLICFDSQAPTGSHQGEEIGRRFASNLLSRAQPDRQLESAYAE